MSLASCCGPDELAITPDSIVPWAVAALICGVLLLLEALAIVIRLRKTGRRFWHRKFVILITTWGIAAMIYAWQAFGAYDALRNRIELTLGDVATISHWDGFGCLAFWVAISLLCAGPWYLWVRRDLAGLTKV